MLTDEQLLETVASNSDAAVAAEAAGHRTLWVGETQEDPFLRSLILAQATKELKVGTAIAVAFARSPMTVALSAWDLARYSEGRFVLGLGSQIKPHIERRFSMPWSHPAPRMREYVLALRAIWACWQDGAPLDFTGEFYTHTLMTPFFTPPPLTVPLPPVFLAAVGDLMTEVAGEVADGWFWHPFTTQRYLREVSIPALERGRAKSSFTGLPEITGGVLVAVGRDQQELDVAITGTKKQIAFYASTPAYKGVLDLHGHGDLQPELSAMARRGEWDAMGEKIPDDLLDAIAVVGSPAEAGRELQKRWGDVAAAISFYPPYEHDKTIWSTVKANLA